MKKLRIFTDGASRGNPGEAAIAFLVFDTSGKLIGEGKKIIGIASNNEAEYRAILEALSQAGKYSHGEVECFSDSQLVVHQLRGDWKIKKTHLRTLSARVKDKEKAFARVSYTHVRRTHPVISRADRMVNEVLDGAA